MSEAIDHKSDSRENIESLFISDIHIGCGNNNIGHVLEILDEYKFNNLFLVGDIIDCWALAKKWRWKKKYGKLINKLIELKKEGVNIVYVLGNHESSVRSFCPLHLAILDIYDEYIYKDILIIHGDKFDTILEKRKYLYYLGDFSYRVLIYLNVLFPNLSRSAKKFAKDRVNYLSDFYNVAAKYTLVKKCRRIVAGHTHFQEKRIVDGVEYWNCGDFREDSSYIVEKLGGNLELRNK